VSNLGESFGWGLAVGGTLLVGAIIAAFTTLPKWASAAISAFGAGTLLAAVALELVPEADEQAGVTVTAACLILGAAIFVGADALLTRTESRRMMRRAAHAAAAGRDMAMPGLDDHTEGQDGEAARGESIAVGIVVDGIPESIALGITIAIGELGLALLVGILIGNVVEGYGAAQPIIASGKSKQFVIRLLTVISLALLFATVLGGTVFADASPGLIGGAQAIAAGGVLAVVSISIIPHAFDDVDWGVAIAVVLGFVLGYLLS
jgi:ZIP family zinc transporter